MTSSDSHEGDGAAVPVHETGERSRARGVLAASVAVVILAIVVRVFVSGPAALERGDAALAVGDHLGASASWREAISWYLPLAASWRETAMDRLDELARERSGAGDLPGAVMALSSLRSGVMAGHGLLRPDEDRLVDVDGTLSVLLADWEAEDARTHGRIIEGDRDARVAFFAARLAKDPRPARSMSALALAGLVLWIVSMFRAAEVGIVDRRRWWILAVSGLTMMLTGVALA